MQPAFIRKLTAWPVPSGLRLPSSGRVLRRLLIGFCPQDKGRDQDSVCPADNDATGAGNVAAGSSPRRTGRTGSPDWLLRVEQLHLPTSVRSYRCLATTQCVNALLEGRIIDARRIAEGTEDFPIYLTRSLEKGRHWLLANARGKRRCGLVASSGARRLRAD